MKLPKTKKAFCRKCKTHTTHKVALNKTTGNRGTLKRYSIARAKKRGRGTGYGNTGKYGSKPPVTKWKRAGSKTSKKTALKLTCSKCTYAHILPIGRNKKTEFV